MVLEECQARRSGRQGWGHTQVAPPLAVLPLPLPQPVPVPSRPTLLPRACPSCLLPPFSSAWSLYSLSAMVMNSSRRGLF